MTIPSFLEHLDITVFSVPSSTTHGDRTSLLRLHKLVSTSVKRFNYLEIGSDRGGSLVPLLADPNCAKIVSIDLRPELQPDERGTSFPYPVDGEVLMMKNLRERFSEIHLARMQTFKLDIRDVDAASLPKIDLALIDGEHTDVACFSDADRVLDFVKKDAVIIFHDSNLISDAIQNFERMLTRLKIEHSTVFLPDVVAAIGLGKFASKIQSELGTISAPRAPFFAQAQLHRWIAVSNSMRDRGFIQDNAADKEREIAELRDQKDTLVTQIEDAKRTADQLRKSTSWKITAPLRSVAHLLK